MSHPAERPATGHIPTRPLRRGPALTELGFGAVQLVNLYRPTSDEEAAGAVAAAWDAGVRCFDTAPHYGPGLSERRPGAALAGRPREEYAVSTEIGRLLVPSPETNAACYRARPPHAPWDELATCHLIPGEGAIR
ncbi:hypothetical protein ADL12_23400 [Streptomyces regalis]|uniref:NADP-dependent oxidoreductase domain-containing protein n=1 Tax=Streptomyces regalis TaxID=68262 RepID=A0A101JSD4_9ACTN|nr:hypothetical protein ADL12_23400 [Streptomyces regalis]